MVYHQESAQVAGDGVKPAAVHQPHASRLCPLVVRLHHAPHPEHLSCTPHRALRTSQGVQRARRIPMAYAPHSQRRWLGLGNAGGWGECSRAVLPLWGNELRWLLLVLRPVLAADGHEFATLRVRAHP